MKKITIAAALILALLLVFTGCSDADPNASVSPFPAETASAEIAGPSASPTESIETVTAEGSDYVFELVDELGATYTEANPGVTVDTSATNSNTAIASVAGGNADIALSSRPLKAAEKAVFKGLKENLICKDGLVVVVSKDCPVSSLSAQQIKDIFMGDITNWAEVDGEDSKITVYSISAGTDIRKRFNEQFLGVDDEGTQNDSSYALEVTNSTEMAGVVGEDPAAIGYMPLSAITAEDNIKAITIDAVLAIADNVKSGSYAYVLNYYLITNEPSAAAQAFVDYCKGADAKAAMIVKGLIVP